MPSREDKQGADEKMNEETVTIPKERYEELLKSEKRLQALEAAGVDNWEGFAYAIEQMEV